VLITGSRVVAASGVLDPGWVEVSSGRIAALGAGSAPRPADIDLGGGWLVPGFVDMHAHGGGGASVLGADPDAVARVVAAHRAHGTTSIVASLVSAPPDPLAADVAALADLVEDGLIAGIHLEGPWISPAYKGAHDAGTLRDPHPSEVGRLLAAGRGHVVMVTLAPEREHGLDATRRLAAEGVVPAVGHTDAGYDVVRAAIDAGATVATHLFNAMRPLHHRDPGPVAALLGDERVCVELIADGVHLHPAVLALAHRSSARIALVTDAMAAAGAGDGEYRLGDLRVRVEGGTARLVEGGAIAGSTLTMDVAFRRAVRLSAVPIEQAVQAASTTPARLLRLDDRGRIAVGLRADLCHVDDDLRLVRVWAGGAPVEPAAPAT
jgi:N-acetylglucosamine-6-phosphate deacetylase